MEKKELDMKEWDIDKDTTTITFKYTSGQTLEAIRNLMNIHIMRWGRAPEYIVVDEVTFAMIKLSLFDFGAEGIDPTTGDFEKVMGMTIIKPTNVIMFTQNEVKLSSKKDVDEDEG